MVKQSSEKGRPGRKPIYGDGKELSVKINIRLSAEEKQFLISLGGSEWVRERIRHAPKSECPGPGSGKGALRDARFQARMLPQDASLFKKRGGSRWLRHQLDNEMKMKRT